MAIPTYDKVTLPLLRKLADGEPHRIRDLYETLADELALSVEDRSKLLPSGQQRVFHNRIGWARTYLKKAGLIESPRRGWLTITQRGSDVLKSQPTSISAEFLEQFEEFRDFIRRTPHDLPDEVVDQITSTASPEEVIDDAFGQLQDQLASELLDTLKSCSPYFFEKVVLRLLQEMGYGGLRGRGFVTPRSGDGGIDGVIHEDKLGLDTVCIQAKRWEGTVGRRTVQEFVGSMDLHRSRKGVILTTSGYSADAVDYVQRIEGKKVILIDGDQLTRLMIENRVGLTVTKTYELADISQDFFDEDA